MRFGTKLYRQVVGFPWALIVPPCLFLFCYDREFVMSLSDGGPAGVVGAFGAASRCLGDILNVIMFMGAHWLSGRVLDSRLRGRGFELLRRYCVVIF